VVGVRPRRRSRRKRHRRGRPRQRRRPGIAARGGESITFWHFTKYGIVTTIVTLLIAWAYVWLRYFAFG
jgi:hypothetical protein